MREHRQIIRSFKGIIDTTLREGFQFAGADFSPAEQRRIFRLLCRIGVDRIEVGNPSKAEIAVMIKSLTALKLPGKPMILAHIRNHERDLKSAADCGVGGVNILFCADSQRIGAMNLTFEESLLRLESNVRRASSMGMEVRVGVEDAFTQPYSQVLETYLTADRMGAHRIGVADTLGNHFSWEVYNRIRDIRRRIRADIEVHFHNDLGHSVGNALSALAGGANWVNASLLGIGERTGITPLSSLLVNLYRVSPELTSRYRLNLLTSAENRIAEICNIETPINLVTNRASGFAHKAGIHLDAMMKFGPQKYEPFSPNLIGNSRRLLLKTLISGKTNENDARKFKQKYRF